MFKLSAASTIFVTGGAGFIGSAVVRDLIENTASRVIVLDKLTYAGNLSLLRDVEADPRFIFKKVDICDQSAIDHAFTYFQPDAVIHLAAETHVDRSIDGPAEFIKTNVFGTFVLLEAARQYLARSPEARKGRFRFHHVSTDEVFGDLADDETYFTEDTPYAPSSPYSASKASSDHLVRAWGRTFGLPYLITNCSNNYGPFHFPEKLIPLTIINALRGEKLPVFGNGLQVRDWLFVEDHARALITVLTRGALGASYNIGGWNEKTNIEVVLAVCRLLDEIAPQHPIGIKKYEELINFVEDRPGHDNRYAIDSSKVEAELGWHPQETFESGLRKTVHWFVKNKSWWSSIELD